MALINCPECNKEISDKAECCINCGYKLPKQEPMFQGVYCPKCLDVSIKKMEIDTCPFCHTKYKNSIYGASDETFGYTENHPELKQSPEFSEEAYNKRINYVPVEYSSSSSAKCPTCSSQNIKRVSTTSKILNTAVFGIFGTKRHKQFHCNSCGYEW